MKCVIGPNQTSGMCPVTSLQLQLQLPIPTLQITALDIKVQFVLAILQTKPMLEKNNNYNLDEKNHVSI